MVKQFNIYLAGVGGQGIGLLSEVLLRATNYAGYAVKGVDTHGLAQRGGVVISQIRIGRNIYSPIISKESSDLVVALERHEALRSLEFAVRKDGEGKLVYYDTVWQPDSVRLGKCLEIYNDRILEICKKLNVAFFRVKYDKIEETRMQNIIVLAEICYKKLIPNVGFEHYEKAMNDLIPTHLLRQNLILFDKYIKEERNRTKK